MLYSYFAEKNEAATWNYESSSSYYQNWNDLHKIFPPLIRQVKFLVYFLTSKGIAKLQQLGSIPIIAIFILYLKAMFP